jgi:hypothetical protein
VGAASVAVGLSVSATYGRLTVVRHPPNPLGTDCPRRRRWTETLAEVGAWSWCMGEMNPMAISKATEFDPRFHDTTFVVNATSFERLRLWSDHHADYEWKEDSQGWGLGVGEFHGFPVVISIVFAKLRGKRILFWEAVSRVVDTEMIENWFEANCCPRWDGGTRRARTNAMNFHHVLDHVRTVAESAAR